MPALLDRTRTALTHAIRSRVAVPDAVKLPGLQGSALSDALWRHPLGTLSTTAVRWALGQARIAGEVAASVPGQRSR